MEVFFYKRLVFLPETGSGFQTFSGTPIPPPPPARDPLFPTQVAQAQDERRRSSSET